MLHLFVGLGGLALGFEAPKLGTRTHPRAEFYVTSTLFP